MFKCQFLAVDQAGLRSGGLRSLPATAEAEMVKQHGYRRERGQRRVQHRDDSHPEEGITAGLEEFGRIDDPPFQRSGGYPAARALMSSSIHYGFS